MKKRKAFALTETLSPQYLNKDFTRTTDITLDDLTNALQGCVKKRLPVSVMSAQDRAEYLALLNGGNAAPIPDDQANRILDTLWSIMVAFVDLGFPPLSDGSPCGQVGKNTPAKCDSAGRDALYSSRIKKTENTKTAPAADGRES